MDFLFLTTPSHHTAKNDAVELNAKRLKKWLDDLPVMNVVQTVKALHEAIESFNELQMIDDERLKLLEVYHVAMDDILFSYDAMKMTMLPISIEERRQLQSDIMWLYLSLANGYKSIVKSGFEQKLNPRKNNSLVISIYRSMELIINAMLYAFRSHEVPPALVYLEINQLYLYAENNHIEDCKIKNITLSRQSTIAALYKQIILLLILDPYRVNSNELQEIFLFIENFSTDCVIEDSSLCKDEVGKYLVDLAEDSPPVFCAYAKKRSVMDSGRIIDVWPVVQAFGSEISNEDMNMHSDIENFSQQAYNQTHKFIDILTQQLMGEKNRKTERKPVNYKCCVFNGLSAVNFYFMNRDKIKQIVEFEEMASMMASNLEFKEQAGFSIDIWQTVDESDNGCLLEINKKMMTHELVIGDIAGLIVDDGKGNNCIKVALIRWLKGDADTFKMGVEFLYGNVPPIMCQIPGDNLSYDGLYFSEDDNTQKPSSLLVEQDLLVQSGKFDITIKKKSFSVEYLSTISETSLYSQFRYKATRKG